MSIQRKNNVIVLLIALLSIIASAYGIFSNQIMTENQTVTSVFGETVTLYGKGLYQHESISMAAQVRAQDIITLCIAIPGLLYSLYLTNKGSKKGAFLLTGMLGYFLYTYASYCFVAMYNDFFLIFVLLMGLAFFGFIMNLIHVNAQEMNVHFRSTRHQKKIAYFMMFFGIIIALMWLGRIVPTFKGLPPEGIEHYTTLPIQALDLAIIAPTAFLSGYSLLKGEKLGYVLTPILMIKGLTMLLAIEAMMISMIAADVTVAAIELVVFSLFTLVFSFILILFMREIKSENKE